NAAANAAAANAAANAAAANAAANAAAANAAAANAADAAAVDGKRVSRLARTNVLSTSRARVSVFVKGACVRRPQRQRRLPRPELLRRRGA
ncbi:hypothetical protein, partial [Paractinoplanes deccanensis]|uniref:hypothetical protein n=1 Tax=Paractinoplanes deccanensis TaxID=113561 RepID=UPI0019408246